MYASEVWVSFELHWLWDFGHSLSGSLANTCFSILLWWTFLGLPISISPFFFFFLNTAAWYPFWDLFIPFSETITQGVLTFSLQRVVIQASLLVFLWDCISWEVLQKGERTCLISGLYWWWIPEEASVSSCYLDPWNCLYSYFFPDEQMLLQPSLQVIKLLTSIAVFCLM